MGWEISGLGGMALALAIMACMSAEDAIVLRSGGGAPCASAMVAGRASAAASRIVLNVMLSPWIVCAVDRSPLARHIRMNPERTAYARAALVESLRRAGKARVRRHGVPAGTGVFAPGSADRRGTFRAGRRGGSSV